LPEVERSTDDGDLVHEERLTGARLDFAR
jgi:hypothetical protein